MKRWQLPGSVSFLALAMISLSGCQSLHRTPSPAQQARREQQPAKLPDFTPTCTAHRRWSLHLGRGERRLGLHLHPAVDGGVVYATGLTRGVDAVDVQTGQVRWHYQPTRTNRTVPMLSGSPAVGEQLVVVGGLDGQIIALDQTTGHERWHAVVPSEVITAAAIGQGLVIVHGVDGRLTALDAQTGAQRWSQPADPPNLTVRGNATVVIGPGVAFVGNDRGAMAMLSLQDGRPVWEQPITTNDGRNELERLADVDGAIVLEGNTLYASSYKNATAALDGPSGRLIWRKDHGGSGGVAVTSGLVIVTDDQGVVWGLDKNSGVATWSQDGLVRRLLSPPGIQGDYVVVGDYKGYLHWLHLTDGALAARMRIGRHALIAPVVDSDGTILVQTARGVLAAIRLDCH